MTLSNNKELTLEPFESQKSHCKSVLERIPVVELDQNRQGAFEEAPPPSIESRDRFHGVVRVHEVNFRL